MTFLRKSASIIQRAFSIPKSFHQVNIFKIDMPCSNSEAQFIRLRTYVKLSTIQSKSPSSSYLNFITMFFSTKDLLNSTSRLEHCSRKQGINYLSGDTYSKAIIFSFESISSLRFCLMISYFFFFLRETANYSALIRGSLHFGCIKPYLRFSDILIFI